MEYQNIIDQFVECCKRTIGNQLVGVYLHGSLAMNCFNPQKSDFDFLVVSEGELSDAVKRKFMDEMIPIHKEAPGKGIEMSIVEKEYCSQLEYPTPFVLHFSRAYLSWYEENPEDYILKMKGTDVDLAAHFMVIKKRGITLYGKYIDDVFGEIQETAYMESIREDIADAKNMVVGDPMYTILSLCRVVAFVEEGLVLSKKEGGEWGLQHVKEPFQEFIIKALSCYESDEMMEVGEEAILFCDYMLKRIYCGQIQSYGEDMIIRKMTLEDVPVICREEAAQGWHPSKEKYLMRLKDMEEGKSYAMVIEYKGAVAGYCNLYYQPIDGPFVGTDVPEIVDLGVFEKYRRLGIGSKLMDVAEGLAKEIHSKVCLGVGLHSGYGSAQRMYVKRGYLPDGSGLWYQNKRCGYFESCINDDDLVLYFSKTL